jgi:hypothetical protein
MRADALVELLCIGLDPAEQGRVIHLHTTIREHALEVAIADWELEIPADRPQDDLRRELTTLERVLLACLHHEPLSTQSAS